MESPTSETKPRPLPTYQNRLFTMLSPLRLRSRGALVLLFAVVVVLVGLFVWPTHYRYDRMKARTGFETVVRIDRLTGRTEMLRLDGWRIMRGKAEALPTHELEGFQGTCKIIAGHLECQIYNGSYWAISELTVRVTVSSPAKTLTRMYRISKASGVADPLTSTKKWSAALGFEWEPEWGSWSWTLVGARGWPSTPPSERGPPRRSIGRIRSEGEVPYATFKARNPEYKDWSNDSLYKNLRDPAKFKQAFPEYRDWSDADVLRSVQKFAPKGFAERHPGVEAGKQALAPPSR